MGWCARYCTGALPCPPKYALKEVYFFLMSDFLLCITVAKRICYGHHEVMKNHVIVFQCLIYYFVFYGGPLATIDNGGWSNVVIDREVAWIKLFARLLYNILLNSSQRKPHQPLFKRVALALERVNPLRNLLCYGSGACRMLMWFVTIQPYYTNIPTGRSFSPVETA